MSVLKKILSGIKAFFQHGFFIAGAVVCVALFAFTTFKDKAGDVLSFVREIPLPDISLAKITDFLGQPERTWNSLRDKVGSYSQKAGQSVTAKKPDGIRLADQLKGISGEDVKNAAVGAATTYFGFWEHLADTADTDLSPIINKLGESPSIGNGYLSSYFPAIGSISNNGSDNAQVPYAPEETVVPFADTSDTEMQNTENTENPDLTNVTDSAESTGTPDTEPVTEVSESAESVEPGQLSDIEE